MMKILSVSLLILLLSISCQVNPCQMTSDEFDIKGSYLGKIHVSKKENCTVYITIEGVFSKSSLIEFHTCYPINLASKFKKDGLYIRFNYTLSHALSPEGCKTDAVISVSNVEKSKSSAGFKFP